MTLSTKFPACSKCKFSAIFCSSQWCSVGREEAANAIENKNAPIQVTVIRRKNTNHTIGNETFWEHHMDRSIDELSKSKHAKFWRDTASCTTGSFSSTHDIQQHYISNIQICDLPLVTGEILCTQETKTFTKSSVSLKRPWALPFFLAAVLPCSLLVFQTMEARCPKFTQQLRTGFV